MSDYQGSQAFAQISAGTETVNRNTGSLNYSIPLIELRGIVQSVGLKLALTYSAGIGGNFGLPQNWTFGISYVIPNNSVTTQGRTYVIDSTWSDATGYKSGLKYVNNHGMLFTQIVSQTSLPSRKSDQYGWSFRYTDGAIDYFEPQGKLIEHIDIHGNKISYNYVDSEASPQTALLSTIQDSWGQVITFGYEPGSAVTVTGPNNYLISIIYDSDGVQQVQLPLGISTSINYLQFTPSRIVISSINQSSGLQSSFVYQTLYYLDSNNQQQSLPAVQDHYNLDANGGILSHTAYRFGTASGGQTFTGYAIQAQMGSGSDGLMETGSVAYQYDSLILNMDINNNIISASRIVFNYLHLPVVEFHYGVDQAGYPVDTYRAINTYVVDPDLHARTPNYTSPSQVQHYNWNPSSNTWQNLRLATSVSDSYGCPTYNDESIWDPEQQKFVLAQSKKCTYIPVPWGGQMITTETFVDEITGFTKQLSYTLTSDQKNVAVATTNYNAGAGQQPWKTKTSTYDSNGRTLTQTIAWSNGSSFPDDTVTSYTNSNQYAYDTTNNYLTITAIDPQGKATVSKFATNVQKGPIIEKKLPLGQAESFTYDLLGRKTSQTDAASNTTTLKYVVSSSENSVTSSASNDYQLKYILDALGRCVQLLDNGDSPISSPTAPTRTVFTKSYDSLSRLSKSIDGSGLVVSYNAYDAFNRVLSVTDPDNNTTTVQYDDITMQITSLVNGSLRSRTQLDCFSRKASATMYADDSDTAIDYCLTETHVYDGFGKVVTKENSKQPLDGTPSTRLGTLTRVFDVEANVKTETFTSLSDTGGYDTIQRVFSRDIFGAISNSTKYITYSDGRSFTHPGATNIYDSCRQWVRYQNQLGQAETYQYDDNGWHTKTTRFDGSTMTYEYDNLGRAVAVSDSDETQQRSYLSNNRLSSITVNDATVAYAYNLGGSILSVTYPGDHHNSYGLDSFDRIVSQTDVNGVQRTIVFDSNGHVSSRSIGNDTVTYQYGTANHTNGQVVQVTISGAQVRNVAYDGYGRANSVVDTDVSGLLLSSVYHYSPQNKLKTLQVSSPHSDLCYTKAYTYDGLGQLLSEITTFTNGTTDSFNYMYDGNCNILSKTQNGTTEQRSYNSIDQRMGFTYDVNGRLSADDTTSYSYFADDRLKSAKGVAYTYHPDSSLASSATSSTSSNTFYYDTGAVNATKGSTQQLSYQLEPGRRLASYDENLNPQSYFLDSNNSLALLTSPSGTVSTYNYAPYGAPDGSTEEAQFGYRGEYTDASNGLVYLRSRYYNPSSSSFLTMDTMKKENRYAYCGGDPINRSDSTGHSADGALVAGIVAGVATTIIVGVLTGGLAAEIFGPSVLLASMSATAMAGAAGSMVADEVDAAASGRKVPGSELAIDAISGAVGGAVGAGTGGVAGTLAMEMAEPIVLSVQNVSHIGTAVSSTVGGATGSLAGGIVANVLSGRPAFNKDSALDFLTGAIAVMLTANQPATLHVNTWTEEWPIGAPRILKDFSLQDEHNKFMLGFTRGDFVPNDVLRLEHGDGETYDTFAIHGSGADVYPAMHRTVNGVTRIVYRPMKGRAFAQVLRQMQIEGQFGNNDSIKAISCHAAYFNAKSVAQALQRNVYGSYKAISGFESNIAWRMRPP